MAYVSKDDLSARITAAYIALDAVNRKNASLKLSKYSTAMAIPEVGDFQAKEGTLTVDKLYGPNTKAALQWYLQTYPKPLNFPEVNPKFASVAVTWKPPTLEPATKPAEPKPEPKPSGPVIDVYAPPKQIKKKKKKKPSVKQVSYSKKKKKKGSDLFAAVLKKIRADKAAAEKAARKAADEAKKKKKKKKKVAKKKTTAKKKKKVVLKTHAETIASTASTTAGTPYYQVHGGAGTPTSGDTSDETKTSYTEETTGEEGQGFLSTKEGKLLAGFGALISVLGLTVLFTKKKPATTSKAA